MRQHQRLLNRIIINKFETLESRQMLAFSADISFQPWWTRAEAGVTRDIGFPYYRNAENGFGWNHWKANEMTKRDGVSSDAAPSSFVDFNGSAGEEDVWEMSLPDGTYTVTLTAGDSESIDSYYAFDLEGVSALRGAPTLSQKFVTGSMTVEVTDGRLTLTAGDGAFNNKLNLIRIEEVEAVQVPAKPTGLQARTSGSNVELTWDAVDSRIDGYVIQQSEDGVRWRAVAYAGNPAARYTLTGVDSSVAHQFRIFAFRGTTWSPASNIARVPAVVTPDPTPAAYFDGVTVNPEYDPYEIATALRTLGVNAVRIWGDIEWNKFVNRNFMDAARAYHNLGFHVTLLITDDKVPTYDQAKAYFNFAVSQPGLAAAVNRWEIINEPNFSHYWTGTIPQYVNNVLKPAYEVLKANGEIVVGAAAGVFTSVAQDLKDAGYLNYVDYANYHPYGIDADEQIQRVSDVKRIFAGKPLTLTEWNLLPYLATRQEWAAELKKVRSYIVNNVESAFYFHFTYTADWGSVAGLFKPDAGGYVANPIFYDMYQAWNIQRAGA